MPRMPKKVKKEMAFFLKENGRIGYYEFCVKCVNDCKQSFRLTFIDCPYFLSKRSKEGKAIMLQKKLQKENGEPIINK